MLSPLNSSIRVIPPPSIVHCPEAQRNTMLLTLVVISDETKTTEFEQISTVPPIWSRLLRVDSVETQPPSILLELHIPPRHRLQTLEVLQVVPTQCDPQTCWLVLTHWFPLQVLHPSNLSESQDKAKVWHGALHMQNKHSIKALTSCIVTQPRVAWTDLSTSIDSSCLTNKIHCKWPTFQIRKKRISCHSSN